MPFHLIPPLAADSLAYMATVYRRGETWTAQWYRADGSRVAKATGATGKREAEKRAAEMEADDRRALAAEDPVEGKLAHLVKLAAGEARDGKLTARRAADYLLEIRRAVNPQFQHVTVMGQVAEWVAQQGKRVSDSTAKSYKEMESAVKDALGAAGGRPLADLTHKDCEALIHALKTGSKGKRTGSTANMHFRAFRRAIQAAVRAKLIADNPAEGITPLPEDDSTERAPFTSAEAGDMIHHEKTSDEWRGMILIGGYTGLRMSDILKLDSKLIDKGVLVMRPKKTSRRGKAAIVRIPLAKPVLKWLQGRKGPLFPKICKKTPQTLSYQFKRIMAAAGVPDRVVIAGADASRSFHSLRHSFTTWLAEADIHPDVRKKLTGHSTAEAHALYTHHDESLQRAIDALPDLTA